MRKFFKKHEEWLLIGLTALFAALIALYFIWGIKVLVVNLGGALAPGETRARNILFDLEGARQVLQLGENEGILENVP